MLRGEALVLSLVLVACATHSPRNEPLAVDAAMLARSDARCASKISKGPFQYFRYTNRPFVDLVCDRFAKDIPSMPLVASHGDAHLEQYAVALAGRGLADFDAAAVGPPVVDLTRFATSIVLAANDEPSARAAIAALLDGYNRSLADPSLTGREPAVAARLRSRFAATTTEWLDESVKLIQPIQEVDRARFDAGYKEFVEKIRAKNDNTLPESFFTLKAGGRLDLGIGSAHAPKYLVRIEGPTDSPDDDFLIEAKALEAGALGKCMQGTDLDATRVLKAYTNMGSAPDKFIAAISIAGRPFYVHTWQVHYRELSIRDIQSPQELAEISFDVGLQLGKGHGRGMDIPALQASAARFEKDIQAASFALATEVRRAWSTYNARYQTL